MVKNFGISTDDPEPVEGEEWRNPSSSQHFK